MTEEIDFAILLQGVVGITGPPSAHVAQIQRLAVADEHLAA